MKNNLYLVADIGGTKILVVIFDDSGNIIFREKLPTPQKPTPAKLVKALTSLDEIADPKTKMEFKKRIKAAGICFAGFVEHPGRLIHEAPNLGWKEPVALAELVEDILNVPVIIENDANAAVVGEVKYGAAKGYSDVIYVTLSTGIGGGLYLNNSLYRGSFGFAGEVGHTKAFGSGRLCNCGGQDCLETWASGRGMAKSASEIWEPGDLKLSELTTPAVFEEADQGNPTAQRIIDQAVFAISTGLSNIVNIINPSCLVIGGGIVSARPELMKKIEKGILTGSIKPALKHNGLKIVLAGLGSDSGIWGIYALLKNQGISP